MTPARVRLLLCGDVMTGRGVDQVLPHPGDPRLWEPSIRDAIAQTAGGQHDATGTRNH